MCGIAGIVDFQGGIAAHHLPQMLHALRHRGPDSAGDVAGEYFHVGMRRLSIIDCAGGQQPIYNEDRSAFVIQNGEIYNYKELRNELEKQGHQFRTQSDTEVLIHLYEQYGKDFASRLNGMFAILVGDLRNRTLHLVRDRLGIKPLYLSVQGSRIWFSSELRSMLAGGLDRGPLSQAALGSYLSYLCIPTPDTPFESIRKVPAACRVEISISGVKQFRWWKMEDFVEEREVDFDEAAEELKAIVSDSIRLQLRSDVPVGTCLSGGVDSSLVTALSARHHPDQLDTFFAAFEPIEFDERPYARSVSERFRTRHREIQVSADEAVNGLSELAWMLDEPHGDAAALPTYLVSKLAAQHVKVCLSGLGGDELFGGYGRYRNGPGRIARLASLPVGIVQNLLRPLFQVLDPARARELDWCIMHPHRWQAYQRTLRQSPDSLLKSLFPCGDFEESLAAPVRGFYERCSNTSEPNRRMFVDAQLYMNDQLLQLTDRMSMACSLEMRVPLIDHRVVEFSLGLPAEHKLGKSGSKLILRRAFGDVLPAEIFTRPKHGFGPPHHRWVGQPSFRPLIERAARGELAADGVLDRKGLEAILLQPSGAQPHAQFVWMLVCLELWYAAVKQGFPVQNPRG